MVHVMNAEQCTFGRRPLDQADRLSCNSAYMQHEIRIHYRHASLTLQTVPLTTSNQSFVFYYRCIVRHCR